MIHRITEIVKLLFQRVSVERILTDKKSRKLYYDDFNLEYLQDLMLTYCQEFSDTEMNLQIMEIQTQMNEINKNMVYQYAENKFNVFSVLFYCVPNILIFHENRVVCQYKQLLEWNKLVKAIGEDVPVLSMIAIRDIEQGIENRNFSWSPVIGHNNKQLERILNKGIADNHFHLRGSSPYFDISWMNLMNSPTKRSYQKDIEKIEKDYRDKNKKAEIQIPKQPARILIAQASLIRLYLCSRIENLQIKFSEYIISSEIIWEQIYILLLNHEYYKNMVTSICKYVKSLSRDDNSFLIYELLQAIKADETCNCYFPYLLQFLRLFENISVSITNTSPDYSDLLQSMFKQLFVKRPKIKLDDCRNCLPEHIFYNFWKQESWNTVEKLLDDPFQMEIHMVNIQIILDSMTSKTGNIDYMLQFAPDEWYSTEEAYRILAGERWFLYKILRGVLSDDQSFTREEYNLFYAYLRIKNEIRSELIQTNSIVGFENFQIYQSRKDWFSHTENYRESEAILAKLAVRDVLNNPAVRFLEVRISPGKTAEENVDNIRGYDMAIIQAYDKDEKFRNVIEEILDNKQNTRMRNFSKMIYANVFIMFSTLLKKLRCSMKSMIYSNAAIINIVKC